MPQHLLLVAATTGYQTQAFTEAARRLNVTVTLATDRCHVLENPWGDNAIPVRFDTPYPTALSILGRFDAIIAVGDQSALVAAIAAQNLGLPFHPVSAVEASKNKYLARERFRAAGLQVPGYYKVRTTADPVAAAAQAPYPCVLKPLGLSASRGVIRANTPEEFAAAFTRIRRLLETPDILRFKDEAAHHIQVETYIPGREFAIEGYVQDGNLRTLAIFDKPDPLEGPYFEETLYITPSREPQSIQQELIETTQRALTALGFTNGPVHAELRYNRQGAWMLEAAARPIGGLCARALRFNGGISLEEVLVTAALGQDPGSLSLDGPSSGVMMIPIPKPGGLYLDTAGVEEARAISGIESVEITAKTSQLLLPLPEGASYLGFLFARAATPDAVEQALRSAHAKLSFTFAEALPTLPGTFLRQEA
ncbi:MAG: ATP-grasp domain-containing protein [Bryobacteraceae bacterium]